MNILLIEDEHLIAKTLSFIIKKRNHKIQTIDSGIKAIELIKSQKFDLIITDLMLNDISGFDILDQYIDLFGSLDNKFCIITAYNSDEILKKIKQYNCRYYIKPFDDLFETINQILVEHV